MFPILSRNQIKFIRSLKQKKYRYKFKKYIVEGKKQIADILIHSPNVIDFIVTIEDNNDFHNHTNGDIYKTDIPEFKGLSCLVQPQGVLAVCHIPDAYFTNDWSENRFSLLFDGVQDPGNLGTMVRAAAWYGIDQLLVGPGTVDPFSPKVVQATMGSHTFIKMYQCNHENLSSLSCPILVADMHGQNAFEFTWPENGILVMGNEGQGISDQMKKYASHFITLPSAPDVKTDSLNVSMACTALLTLWYSQQMK